MTKTEIFDEVVSIVKTDASFCKDEHGADAEKYRTLISDDMDDKDFLYLMQSYVASFHVLGHLNFYQSSSVFLSFGVMRYKNALYVTENAPDSPIKLGDIIEYIDGKSIDEYALLHEDMLYGEDKERQGICWRRLLRFANELYVKHADGTVTLCPVPFTNDWEDTDKYYCKKLRKNVAYMRLLDFSDDIAIANMYKENDALLRSSEYLIIDVRANSGGNDSAFMPLLELCLPEGAKSSDLEDGIFDAGMEINYSERNCDSRIKMFEEHLKSDIPADTRSMLTSFLESMKEMYGKGFAKYEGDIREDNPYIGSPLPKRVFIITDENCGSSGDAFVDTMRKSPIVTVVGRPTMGILDFSNCAYADFGDYQLIYPTSRNLYLDNGVQMRNRGIPVDVYIPWTPAHLERDVELDTVFEQIESDCKR